MAIVKNITTKDGQVLYIETNIPAIGVTTLLGFTDTIIETGQAEFEKYFQYSKNGITWSDWLPLSPASLLDIPFQDFDTLFLKYKYTQSGEGTLTIMDISIDGVYKNLPEAYYFNESIFSKYFSLYDLDVLSWYINVSEKLYTNELNKYINFSDGSGNPTDAIAFWQSIAKFFAFYVILSRIYGKFYTNVELINEFLIQRGIFTNGISIIEEYQSLMQNMGYEISKRGTNEIVKSKQESGKLYDGELLRYLGITKNDEFVFNYFLPQHCGWWVDSSSPMYRGLDDHLNANKLKYEDYIISGDTVVNIDPNNKNDISLNVKAGGLSFNGSNYNKLLNVNIGENYIIEFDILVKSEDSLLTVGVDAFTANDEIVNDAFTNFRNESLTKYFIENLNLSRYSNFDFFVPMKFIIYNVNKASPFLQDTLNIDTGNNLQFDANLNIRKIYPIIEVNGDVTIKNLSVRHLYTNYERGFLNMNNFVDIYYNHIDSVKEPQTDNGFNYDFNITF